MAAKYSIVVPDTVVIGMGGQSFEVEVNVSGWFSTINPTNKMQLWFYESSSPSTCIYKKAIPKTASQSVTLTIPAGTFKAGKKYFSVIWDSDGWLAVKLAISEPFSVKDYEMVMAEKIEKAVSAAAVASAAQNAKNTESLKAENAKNSALLQAEIQKNREAFAVKRAASRESSREQAPALSLNEKRIIRKYFDEIDGNGSSTIDIMELKSYLEDRGVDVSINAHVMKIFNEGDLDRNGMIDFSEFCTMMQNAANCTASKHWGEIYRDIEDELLNGASNTRGGPRAQPPPSKKRKAGESRAEMLEKVTEDARKKLQKTSDKGASRAEMLKKVSEDARKKVQKT